MYQPLLLCVHQDGSNQRKHGDIEPVLQIWASVRLIYSDEESVVHQDQQLGDIAQC